MKFVSRFPEGYVGHTECATMVALGAKGWTLLSSVLWSHSKYRHLILLVIVGKNMFLS